MKVFVTGGSGWVGSTVLPELVGAGHEVVGLARSDASAQTLERRGAVPVRGDLTDVEALRREAAAADGVVHLAFRHDFADFAAAAAVDAEAIRTLGEALRGTGKPLVVTSGTPALPGRTATEDDPAPAVGPVGARAANAALALDLAGDGVRVSVLRLPRSVHGAGDSHGFVARLAEIAASNGVSGYVGDGSARWPAVHVADAGRLFRLALEDAPAGSVLHAVGDEGIAFREIATAIGRDLGMPVRPVAPETLGFLGALAAVDQPASAVRTRELLGWAPEQEGLLADIDAGVYRPRA